MSIFTLAQFADDFTDGDFTSNPEWVGETEKYAVSASNELQLYDETQSGSAYLSTASEAINNAVWEFVWKYEFNPSSSNYTDVYLVSNLSDLSGDINGYFVRIGNTSDEISLYQQSGGTKTKIIDGVDGRLDDEPINVKVRVTRDDLGNWTLASDTLGGSDFFMEGNVFDDTHISSFFFGVKSVFSSTRWDKMFFDNFIVTGDAFVDDIAPEFLGYSIVNNTALQLNFSEPMDATTALDPLHYQVSGGLTNPDNVSFSDASNTAVILSFNTEFTPNQAYNVYFQDITDVAGNPVADGNFSFAIIVVEPDDIIINELMADPSPVVNLPENEYLEFFNRRDLPINLQNWKLIIGTSEYTFPATTIEANGYLIVCDSDMLSEFSAYGDAIGMNFSSYWLSNGGTKVELYDAEDSLITTVTYTDDWYQNADKDDGGWSIERIDPNNTCSGMSNWKASENPNGGTPGTLNSIYAENIDNQAPEILSWELSSGNEITLFFSEIPDNSLFEYSNFNLTPDYGQPILISQDEDDSRTVHLQFVASFVEDVFYTLSIQNISDMCGNVMPDTSFSFINYIAGNFDLLITEIMADPSPQVYLPDAEYVELYNASNYPINLSGFVFSQGGTEVVLPAAEIPANSFVCFTDEDDVIEFNGIPNVIPVDGFPSLTNADGELKLVSPEGVLIHFVNYSETWYESAVKMEGGWSLEMIDRDNPCGEAENWAESISENGGTPGEINSVNGTVNDQSSPEILRAIVGAPDTLNVYFSETLHPAYIPNPSEFSVDNGIGTALSAIRFENRQDAIQLVFPNAFEAQTIYTLQMTDTLEDCVGNRVPETLTSVFALPDTLETQDIVINEVLFNPLAGGYDFVEIYNRSDKYINLADLRIATRDDSLQIDNMNVITETGFMIFPGDHVVLSENIASVYRDYYCQNPQLLLEVEDLPSYTNTSGRVVICKRNLEVIDEMYYHEDYHFDLLKEVKGVSLERIDYNQPAADENNWHSAAESAGFGTPTYQNSQYREYGEYNTSFELSPESISPDNDGYQDYLNISYSMEQSGYVMTITIYDAAGHLIRNLTENELLAAEGIIQWDGLDENGQHPGAGIYIVLLDYFDLQGNRKQEKHTCVIAVMH